MVKKIISRIKYLAFRFWYGKGFVGFYKGIPVFKSDLRN